jgi:hypothetical protein
MLTGRQFRLNVTTIGIKTLPGHTGVAVPVRAGSVGNVEVGPTPFNRRMILARWNGHHLGMFQEGSSGTWR